MKIRSCLILHFCVAWRISLLTLISHIFVHFSYCLADYNHFYNSVFRFTLSLFIVNVATMMANMFC